MVFFVAPFLFTVRDFYCLLQKLMIVHRVVMHIDLSKVCCYLVRVPSLCPLPWSSSVQDQCKGRSPNITLESLLDMSIQYSLASLNLSSVGTTLIRPLTTSVHFLSRNVQSSDHLNIFLSVVISFLVAGQDSVLYSRLG